MDTAAEATRCPFQRAAHFTAFSLSGKAGNYLFAAIRSDREVIVASGASFPGADDVFVVKTKQKGVSTMKNRLIAAGITAICIGTASASSHREAPFITKYPQVDATDFYMFMSYEPGKEDFVTMIANYIPVQAPYGGPNYFPLDSNALYEIHIDNDGDARRDISFQFRFRDLLPDDGVLEIPVGDKATTAVLRNVGGLSGVGPGKEDGLNHREDYSVIQVVAGKKKPSYRLVRDTGDNSFRFRKPFDYSGTKTFGDTGYSAYAKQFIHDISVPGCKLPGKVFVGQRHEAFKLALGEIFDLVNFVPIDGDVAIEELGGVKFPGGVLQDPERNALAKNNVTSIALEIHKSCLTSPKSNGVIGAWTTASLRQFTILNPRPTFDFPELAAGRWTQVSRLGMPLVNELVIGYDKKDLFNSSSPQDDAAQFAQFVTHPALPEILNTLFLAPVNNVLAGLNIELPTLAPTNFPRQDLVTAFLTGIPGLNAPESGTAAELLRLNTEVPAKARDAQNTLGVLAGDIAGFPNGRRPGDDTVDIALRVVMGSLCHAGLGVCEPADANVGFVPFTDGVPLSAKDFNNHFPYLLTPYPGSPVDAPLPVPED